MRLQVIDLSLLEGLGLEEALLEAVVVQAQALDLEDEGLGLGVVLLVDIGGGVVGYDGVLVDVTVMFIDYTGVIASHITLLLLLPLQVIQPTTQAGNRILQPINLITRLPNLQPQVLNRRLVLLDSLLILLNCELVLL